jgi:hypothetical protein
VCKKCLAPCWPPACDDRCSPKKKSIGADRSIDRYEGYSWIFDRRTVISMWLIDKSSSIGAAKNTTRIQSFPTPVAVVVVAAAAVVVAGLPVVAAVAPRC